MADSQYELGALTQAVKTLTGEVKLLREKVECVEAKMNRGRGFIVGLMFAASGVGAGVYSMITKALGKG